jgi:hypothetical protein
LLLLGEVHAEHLALVVDSRALDAFLGAFLGREDGKRKGYLLHVSTPTSTTSTALIPVPAFPLALPNLNRLPDNLQRLFRPPDRAVKQAKGLLEELS